MKQPKPETRSWKCPICGRTLIETAGRMEEATVKANDLLLEAHKKFCKKEIKK